MFGQLRTAVVIPALDEERAIAAVITSVPDWVDLVVVVDDASSDDTAMRAARGIELAGRGPGGAEIIRHRENRGVGAAIVTGYRRACELGADAIAVMAGDGQMDPADLPALLEPLASDRADYVKGNRFGRREVWSRMPGTRLAGNLVLSVLTKLTSGYWSVFDSQCGYTAISRRAVLALELDAVFPRYGYPNDLLAHLHSAGARLAQVPVRTIYGPAWKSGITPLQVVHPVSTVLVRSGTRRLARRLARRLPSQLPVAPEARG